MRRLLCVGDGPRDERPLPALLENLLGEELDCTYEDWRQQRRHGRRQGIGPGRGFHRKVAEALLKVRRLGFDGLVAVLDQDTAPRGDRLRQAQRGLDEDRARTDRPVVPAALGEAAPHFEAWLLDDGEAVKLTLEIAASEPIQGVRHCRSPKLELERLIAERDLERDPTKAAVARVIDFRRCRHAKEIGLATFVEQLSTEFQPQPPG